MNPELARFIEYLPPHATILDLGAGNGETAAELTLQGYTVIALDNNTQALVTLSQLPSIHVLKATLPNIPLAKQVDAVWCTNTLPWLTEADQIKTIGTASALLKPNGIIYCSTRSPDPRWKTSMLTPIQPEKIRHAFQEAGLTIVKEYPDSHDPKWYHWFARKR